MAKKDSQDEYYEKLDRISNLRKNDSISEEEYKEEKERLDNKYKTPKKSDNLAIALVAGAAIVLFIFLAVMMPKPETESNDDLDLSVSTSIDGLGLKNNQSDNLTDCEVTINGKFKNTVDILPEKINYLFGKFTDNDGNRFNIMDMEVKEVFVTNCEENPKRYGSYEF